MAGIYSGFEEHPEYPVDDERRFTVRIAYHAYDGPADDPGSLRRPAQCRVCGFERRHEVHRVDLVSSNT